MSKQTLLAQLKEMATNVMSLSVEDAETVETQPREGRNPQTGAVVKDEEKEEEKQEEQKTELAQMSLENGTVIEADAFEPGQSVFIVNEDERVPLPVGQYEIESGVLVVEEEGIIASVGEAPAEEESTEEEMSTEYVTKSDFDAAINEIKSLFSKHQEKSKEEIENLEAKNVELQKELDEKPDGEKPVHSPTRLSKKEAPKANTSKGRFYQFLNSKK